MNNLKNLFHGTKAFLDQIVKNFIQNKSFSCFIRDYSFKNINLQDFVRKTLNKGFNYENDELIGRTKTRELDIIEKQFFTNKNYKIVSTEVVLGVDSVFLKSTSKRRLFEFLSRQLFSRIGKIKSKYNFLKKCLT